MVSGTFLWGTFIDGSLHSAYWIEEGPCGNVLTPYTVKKNILLV